MRLLVDEMPSDKIYCLFSELFETSMYDNDKKRRYKTMVFDCKITGDRCDLDCGICSGLKVLEIKE